MHFICRISTHILVVFLLFTSLNSFAQTSASRRQYAQALKFRRVNTDSALIYIDSAYLEAYTSKNPKWKAEIILAKAKIHLHRGELDLAIQNGLEAHKHYFKLDNEEGVTRANLLLSQAYSITKERVKSEKCLKQVEKYAASRKDEILQIEVINGKGNNCFQAGENSEAMNYYREAEARIKSENDPYLAAKIQNNIANILVNTGKPDEALPLYRRSLAQYKKLNYPLDELLVLYNIGRQYRAANQLDSALYYGNLCLDLGIKIHSLEDIAYAYSGLEVTYTLKGDYKTALQYNELFHQYKDSLAANANNVLVTRLETDYELRLNGRIIEHQKQKLKRNKRKTTIVVLALSFASLLILLGTFFFIKSRKLNKALQKSNSEILEQNKTIDKALQEKDILLKEVHHRVKNSLQIISSLLNLQESQLTDETAIEALRNSKTRIQTIGLMHQSLYQRDADLGKVNSSRYLRGILDLQLNALGSDSRKLETKTDFVEQELSIDQAVPLGLIASEIISNALKHAYDETAHPLLTFVTRVTDNRFELHISDNGKGFESEDFRNHSSLGLEIVEALNNQLHGEMKFASNSDGTSFSFTFSLDE